MEDKKTLQDNQLDEVAGGVSTRRIPDAPALQRHNPAAPAGVNCIDLKANGEGPRKGVLLSRESRQ